MGATSWITCDDGKLYYRYDDSPFVQDCIKREAEIKYMLSQNPEYQHKQKELTMVLMFVVLTF